MRLPGIILVRVPVMLILIPLISLGGKADELADWICWAFKGWEK